MPAPNEPLSGEELIGAVTEELVALHKRYYHREPVSARWSSGSQAGTC